MIEELLQEEIMDETDKRVHRDVQKNESDDSGAQSNLVSTDDDDTSFESPLIQQPKESPRRRLHDKKSYDTSSFQQGAVMTALEEAFEADESLRVNLDSSDSESEELLHENK